MSTTRILHSQRQRWLATAVIAGVLAHAPRGFAQGGASGAVTPPVVVSRVEAVYPTLPTEQRTEADVVLAVTVSKEGLVASVEVLRSGGAAFDDAALRAARDWTFRAATRGDHPIAARIPVSFHFSPPAAPVAAPPSATAPVAPAVPAQPPHPADASDSAARPEGERPPEPAALSEQGARSQTPSEITVHGRLTPPSRGASDFQVRIGELGRVPRQNATEMLKLAPGILLTNEGGEGHAEQVFLRGFDAREGQDIEFSVEGVPINESGNLHGNGYADTHFILPELVESLRVVEGPYDPRQGNYAVAGSANYELGLTQRGLAARYTFGSWGTKRLLLTWGPEGESTHTFAGGELYQTDGFGQNRDAQRGSVMGQYEGRLGERGLWRVFAQGYSTHYHSAGVIRADDYASGKIGFYDSYDLSSFAHAAVPEGGDSSRYSVAADLQTYAGETTLTQQVFAIRRGMRLLENFTGFLLDVQEPLQQTHLQRGDELDMNVDESTFGARGAARVREQAFGQAQELELGYFARADWVTASQKRLEANTGAPYKTDSDLESQLGDLGLYADANLHPFSWLSLRGGLRGEVFTFVVHDLCAVGDVAHPSTTSPPIDQSCLSQQDYGRYREPDQRSSASSTALLPRASVFIGPFWGISLTGSYGQGIRSIDPTYVTQDVKTPFASARSYEAGLSYAGSVSDISITARSIVFQTHVDKDLVFSETAGRNVLGVGTTRTGWVNAVRLTGPFFDEAANLTLVKSSYDDTGLLVAYVPDAVLRSDTALFSDLPLRIAGKPTRAALGAGLTFVGPRALPYGERSQSIFTLDSSATLSWSVLELGLTVTNLFNRRYRLGEFNYASDFRNPSSAGAQQPTLVPERHFTAGAPRGVFATLGVRWGSGT